MKIKFLFMDDSISPIIRDSDGAKISSLTGIVLSPEQVVSTRDSFLKTISPLFIKKNAKGKTIEIDLIPEIHGSDMLRSENREQRLNMFNAISKLPSKHNFSIYRVGYFITRESKKLFQGDVKNISSCWMALYPQIINDYKRNYIVPIMDMSSKSDYDKFSGQIQHLNVMRTAGLGDSIGINNTENLLGEVFFADSQFSIITQVVDVISYIRCINDQKEERLSLSNFKNEIYECNSNLKSKIKSDVVIEWNKVYKDRMNNTENKINPFTGRHNKRKNRCNCKCCKFFSLRWRRSGLCNSSCWWNKNN